MAKDINKALDNVEMVYGTISKMANDMLSEIFDPINAFVSGITDDINNCTVDEIRNYIIRLQLKAYELGEIKEKSAIKAECAEALRKEKFAKSFNEADGTNGVKENLALIETSEEIVVQCLYELVANLLKTKQDSLHRLVDSLKSILVSRMQEARMSTTSIE